MVGAQQNHSMVIVDDLTKAFNKRRSHEFKEGLVWLLKGRKGDLTKRFEVLQNINIEIDKGESVALLGLNGSGKSTLLKLLSGVLKPDSGKVLLGGSIAGLIEVGAGFHHDLTGRENIYLNGAILGMSEQQIDERFDAIVAFSELEEFLETEVRFYSSGMYLRLAFAVAVHTNPDIFLVDEILAVGDEPFQQKCIAKLRELSQQKKTLIVVSHDLALVQQLCERGVLLREGQIYFDGEIKQAVQKLRDR